MSKGRHKTSDKYTFIEGMERTGQGALGRSILTALEEAKWKEQPSPAGDPYKARMWDGKAPGFQFNVFDFELDSQGFDGERGADGAVTGDGFVIRLGHDLSEHAVELARAQLGIT